jgi:hypothetical protein
LTSDRGSRQDGDDLPTMSTSLGIVSYSSTGQIVNGLPGLHFNWNQAEELR